MKIPWNLIAIHRFLFLTIVIIVRSSATTMIQSLNLYGRLHKRRLTYALLFLAETAFLVLLGEVDLVSMAGVVLTLVGEAVFVLAATLALAGVDFDGGARGFLVTEEATLFSIIWSRCNLLRDLFSLRTLPWRRCSTWSKHIN
jgi:hypothetical protein